MMGSRELRWGMQFNLSVLGKHDFQDQWPGHPVQSLSRIAGRVTGSGSQAKAAGITQPSGFLRGESFRFPSSSTR
jgi:hypothetical protein